MPIFTCADCGYEYEVDEDYIDGDIEDFVPEDWIYVDGEYYCNECWLYCSYCDRETPTRELTRVGTSADYACQRCLQEHYVQCVECERYFSTGDTVRAITEEGEEVRVCDECKRNGCIQVDNANLVLKYTKTNHIFRPYFESQEQTQGNLKKEETNLWVYDTKYRSYHPSEHVKFKSLKYRDPHEHPFLYYGIELEVLFNSPIDINRITNEFIRATNGLFVAERDGSVADQGNGCEFISRPLTYTKWMSDEVKNLLLEGQKVLRKYNAYEKQPKGCGLHVHMSLKFFEENTTKSVDDIKTDMDWIFQIFQPEIEKISRRPYTRYCASKAFRLKQILRENYYAFGLEPEFRLKKGELTTSRGSGDTHHDAVIQTRATIEARTFRSTINIDEILATIEFCRAVAHAARNIDLKNTHTLGDIVNCKDSKYLDKYLKDNKVDLTKKFDDTLEVI